MNALTALKFVAFCIVITSKAANGMTYLHYSNGEINAVTEELRQQLKQNQEQLKQTQQQLDDHHHAMQLQLHNQKHELVRLVHTLLMKGKDDNVDRKSHNVSKREIPSENSRNECEDILALLLKFGVTGPPGENGADGAGGADGADGRNGIDGVTGPPGADGADGRNGLDGGDGAPGSPGADGPKGVPGNKGVVGPRGPQGISGADNTAEIDVGAVYTRWGRTNCPSHSTLVYEGFASSSRFNIPGGGVNYQCLPLDPEYSKFSGVTSGWQGSYLAGVEYQSYNYGIFPQSAFQQNVPCARCYTQNRAAVMMIPAKRTCPDDWTKEYEGYLMTEREIHYRATFECVDRNPEYLSGLGANTEGALFYFVKAYCSGAYTTGHCPPYIYNRELTCVVCTK